MPHNLILPTSGPHIRVNIHPVVFFAVCDAYIRRNEKQDRVVGTLLGVQVDNVIEVKNCYVVPHNETSEQVAVDIAHHRTMFDLHQKVSPQEVIVGWFATGPVLYNSDALIQEFYAKECPQPVHLLIDTALTDKTFAIKCYTSRVLSLGDKILATEFVEVPCEVLFGDVEKLGAELLSGGKDGKALAEADNVQHSLTRLIELMDQAHAYVKDVVDGKCKGDPTIGRYLADTLAVVPHFNRTDFERLFNESVQDIMLVEYLSGMIRAHVSLSEKLGTAALPIM